MSKKIAITQSNYIPSKKYFDFINQVDEFVLDDDIQCYNNFRNKKKVKTPQGLQWLTIPVKTGLPNKINEIEIADEIWYLDHWKTIQHLYSQASCFDYYADEIEFLYRTAIQQKISDVNFHFLIGITELLDIKTPFSWSTEYGPLNGEISERLVLICQQAGANIYLAEPEAEAYLDVSLFENQGIEVEWMDTRGYKKYPQVYGEFESAVTVLDLLFNTGKDAASYMKSFNNRDHERAEYFAHSAGSEVY